MNVLLLHWSFDPVLVGVCLAAVIHAIGQRRRFAALHRAGRSLAEWRLRGLSFYAGLVALAVAIASPVDYWSDKYLFAHMLQHVLLGFIAPPLIVIGAPWLALRRGLPSALRRVLARAVASGRKQRSVRGLCRVLTDPIVAFVLFNGAMVAWHFPALFDMALRNQVVHIWGEHSTMFAFGMLLWLQVLESPPFRPRFTAGGREVLTVGTNAVMVGLAMTLVLFSHALYPVYAHQAHVILSQYSDQQVAGSTLWACGEVTLAPTLYWNIQLWLRGQARSGGKFPISEAAPWLRLSQRWRDPSPEAVEYGWRPARGRRVV